MMTKTTKTVLFASLIAAMILPFSATGLADATTAGVEDKEANKKVHPDPPTDFDSLDKTPKELHTAIQNNKNYPKPRDLSANKTSTIAPSHTGFGTLLDKKTSVHYGICSLNEVHDSGITLKDNTTLYAPTILPANKSPVEVVTAYQDNGWFSGTDKNVVLFNHVTGTFNWTNDFVIDSSFIGTYATNHNGSDYYYTCVLKSGDYWYVYIYNYSSSLYELWETVAGSGTIADGWAAWEEHGFSGNCPTTLPEIHATDIEIYDGGWKLAASTYASEHDDGDVCSITNAVFGSKYDDWKVDDP